MIEKILRRPDMQKELLKMMGLAGLFTYLNFGPNPAYILIGVYISLGIATFALLKSKPKVAISKS